MSNTWVHNPPIYSNPAAAAAISLLPKVDQWYPAAARTKSRNCCDLQTTQDQPACANSSLPHALHKLLLFFCADDLVVWGLRHAMGQRQPIIFMPGFMKQSGWRCNVTPNFLVKWISSCSSLMLYFYVSAMELRKPGMIFPFQYTRTSNWPGIETINQIDHVPSSILTAGFPKLGGTVSQSRGFQYSVMVIHNLDDLGYLYCRKPPNGDVYRWWDVYCSIIELVFDTTYVPSSK